MKEDRPVLSLKERERRWKAVRDLMKTKGIDCLMVVGLFGWENADAYLTNGAGRGVVIVPLQGDGTYLAPSALAVAGHAEDLRRGGESWVDDWRAGASAPQIVSVIKEKGFEAATVGVIGLESKGVGQMEGYIPFKTWSYIRDNLPRATFIDISADFFELMLTRGAEEIALIRYAAKVGEMVCETMMKTARPGAGEAEIFAAMMQTMYANGCNPRMLILESGADNLSWGTPLWLHRAGTPRIVQKGDMVQAEIFTSYGGIETQQQMSVGIKPVHPINQEMAKIARRSYEVGLKELRPGNRFEHVAKAMAVPLAEEGCWHLCPLIHSISPQMCGSQLQVGMTGLPGFRTMERYRKSR